MGCIFPGRHLVFCAVCVHSLQTEYAPRGNKYGIRLVQCSIVFTRCRSIHVVTVCLVFVLQSSGNTICTGKVCCRNTKVL